MTEIFFETHVGSRRGQPESWPYSCWGSLRMWCQHEMRLESKANCRSNQSKNKSNKIIRPTRHFSHSTATYALEERINVFDLVDFNESGRWIHLLLWHFAYDRLRESLKLQQQPNINKKKLAELSDKLAKLSFDWQTKLFFVLREKIFLSAEKKVSKYKRQS